MSPRELERKAPRSVWATQLPASRPIRWIVRESREANRTDFARIPSDGLRDAPRASIGRTRPLFIGQTSLALPRVKRTDSHSESPRPLSHGRISPALGRPTPIQPFLNPDMDGINRHATTSQPSLVSNPRATRFRHSHPKSVILQPQPLLQPQPTAAKQTCPQQAANVPRGRGASKSEIAFQPSSTL